MYRVKKGGLNGFAAYDQRTATKTQGTSTRERVENRVLIIWDDVEDYDAE